jgi:diguanylate cyclase (GGDEF)-like protein/PAS domain S-box-containing protein
VTPTARPARILLVESDDTQADGFTALLEEAAPGIYAVVRATTLAEAVTALVGTRAACAVVAIGPDGSAGVEIIEGLANGPSPTALVALMNTEDEDRATATLQAGAHDHLAKSSLSGQLLVRTLRAVIIRHDLELSLAEAQGIARAGSWELDMVTLRLTWSPEMSRLFAFAPDEDPTYQALVDRIHPEDRDATVETIGAMLETSKPFFIEHRVLLPDGVERWIRALGRVELDPAGRPERLLGIAQDISESRAAEDALFRHTFHDPLTGLPNRNLFLDRLAQALKGLARESSTVAVIYLDVDRFKRINDSLGPPVGDQLLVALAARLSALARQEDTVARIGADEFVMLCEGLSGESEAVAVADRIGTAMTEALVWDQGEVVVSVSAGIAVTDSASASADSMLRDADAAMHRAKKSGFTRSVVFVETMRASSVGMLDTEISLRAAIADGDLRLHYQPIVKLDDGSMIGHEALVRWMHPSRGLLGPDQFIAVAEETGLIVPLGAWVLYEACRQARRFQNRHPDWAELTMSVNLSGGQLGQPDLVELVGAALGDADLKPAHLQLEMTESVLMDDAASTITILEALKALDIRLGVDDFGTGYSSLAYLRRFPVDVLKIDRSFVDGLGDDLEDTAIVAAVVSLADTLGLATIAEGVETDLQRACLVSLGCQRGQGYLFARPVAASAAEGALDDLVAGRAYGSSLIRT